MFHSCTVGARHRKQSAAEQPAVVRTRSTRAHHSRDRPRCGFRRPDADTHTARIGRWVAAAVVVDVLELVTFDHRPATRTIVAAVLGHAARLRARAAIRICGAAPGLDGDLRRQWMLGVCASSCAAARAAAGLHPNAVARGDGTSWRWACRPYHGSRHVNDPRRQVNVRRGGQRAAGAGAGRDRHWVLPASAAPR